MPYDLFVSYAHDDNSSEQITRLIEKIAKDYFRLSDEKLTYFFDKDNIKGMDDWRNRILTGLRDSTLLLQILTPTYMVRPNCKWEAVEYLKFEHSRALAGQGIAPIHFIEIPGLYSPEFQDNAEPWLKSVCRRQIFSFLSRNEDDADSVESLVKTLRSRILKLRGHAASPGNLPAGNPHFVGRQTEMQTIHETAGNCPIGVITAVQGVGGLGKTALATQYACSYAQHYPGGRWLVECAGQNSLATVIRQLDVDLGVTFNGFEQGDDTRAAKRILMELESRALTGAESRTKETNPPAPRALLLLDNVESADMLQPPQTDLVTGKPFLHILGTTRFSPDDLGHDPKRQALITVDELPEEDALRLIEDYQPNGLFTSDQERTSAAEIVKLLGGFTLAVEVVAVYLGERMGRVTCSGLLERLRKEGLNGFESVAQTTKRNISHVQKLMSITLKPTLELLTDQECLVLSYAALLPPDSIPLPWLRTLAAKEFPELGKDAEPGYDDPWLSMVNHLMGLRLLHVVEVDPNARTPLLMRMHRLMGELVRSIDIDKERHNEDIVAHARGRCVFLREGWLVWSNRWEIAPLGALAHHLLDNVELEMGACIANEVATLQETLGMYSYAEHLYTRALKVREAFLGNEHLDVATSLNNLAALHYAQGQYELSEPLYVRALSIREMILGSDHPNVASSQNNLATLYHAQGRYAEAEPLYILALAVWQKIQESDNLHLATSINNLGVLNKDMGQYAQAMTHYKSALAIREKVLGPDHPDVAIILSNLATLYRVLGQYDQAITACIRSLTILEKSFGSDHPNIVAVLDNLSVIHCMQGDYAKAESATERAQTISEKAFGLENLHVANSLNNLAGAYHTQGLYDKAKPHYMHALEIRKKNLGPEHPDVANSLNNIAGLYDNQGQHAQAIPLYEQALDTYRKALGPYHPEVANCMNNLAQLYNALGQYPKAESLYMGALDCLLRNSASNGSTNPTVQPVLANYARCLVKMGKTPEEIRGIQQELFGRYGMSID